MQYDRVMSALRRRRWWIALAVLTCTGLTAFGATRMKREYLATATLLPEEQAIVSMKDLTTPAEIVQDREDLAARQDRIKTVAAILSSPTVLAAAIEEIGMVTTPVKLQENLEVEGLTAQLLRVSLKDENPERATATLNAIVERFVHYYKDLRSREAKKQVQLLAREKDEAERELRLASSRLEGFKRSGRISSLPDQTRVLLERAAAIEEARNTTQARLREVSAQVDSLVAALRATPATREIRRSTTNTVLLDRLQGEVSDIRRALEKELTVHTEEHPNVKRLREELANAESRLSTETQRLHTSIEIVANPDRLTLETTQRNLRNERDGLVARLASLNRDLARIQSRVSGLSGKDVTLAILQQKYDTAVQRHTQLTDRYAQVENAAALLTNGTPVSVVDWSGPQNPPLDLSQGRTLKLTALAFIMSLAVCVTLAIGLEMADRRIRSLEDAEMLSQLPVVSVVPQLPGRAGSAELCMTAQDSPSSPLAESYHFLANHILRQTLGRESTVLTGVTAKPGQGATTALCNLGIALARAGRRVVMVEADLRRPFLHEVFQRDSRPGLTDVLLKSALLEEALAATDVPNLHLLTAGREVQDPWSLLWQPEVALLMEELRQYADYVIVNVPSATVFADALCIAPHVDGAILVMRTSEVPTGAEQKVRQWLEEVNVPVMGLVLNGVPARDMETFEFRRGYTYRPSETPVKALAVPGAEPLAPPVRRAA